MSVIKEFKAFMEDQEAFDMFITGQAGTGKTTSLKEVVDWCLNEEIPHVVCAFTHKAVEILKLKLSEKADIRTLYSFLKKRPTINQEAKRIQRIEMTSQFGKPEPIKLLIIDEFSMVGEEDTAIIGELQDPEYKGIPEMKVLYIGDPYQLPPVKQVLSLRPERAKYHIHLKKVYRQGEGPLLDTLCSLVEMQKTGKLKRLESHEQFVRDVDIIEKYTTSKSEDKIILAYTNRKVEELNLRLEAIYQRGLERLWSPSIRSELKVLEEIVPIKIDWIQSYSEELRLGSKYGSLEHLINIAEDHHIKFYRVYNLEKQKEEIRACIFGHGKFRDIMLFLKEEAARSNSKIPDAQPTLYCKKYPHKKICIERRKAWRDYLTINENVICVDYPYAQTVHKSQGSTFEEVYIDNKDLSLCYKRDQKLYLKLLYVAMSRASKIVYMNN